MRAIPEERRKQLVESCRLMSILLDEILPSLVTWAVEAGGLDTLFIASMEKIKDQVRKFPQQWLTLTMSQLGAGAALSNPDKIDQFLSGPGSGLSPGAVDLLRSIQKQPAFFAAFSTVADFGDDLFHVRDYSSHVTNLVFSPALGETVKDRPESLLTLLFFNGSCFQTIGPLHYYRGLAEPDFHYYARLLQAELYERSGLSAVMTTIPERFVVLDAFSETPSVGHKGRRLLGCWSEFDVSSLDPAALASSFDSEEAGGRMRFRLKGSEPPLGAADLYWDSNARLAFVYATSVQGYEGVVAAARGVIDVPPQPHVAVTGNMEVIAKNLLGVDPPVFKWEKPFTPSQDDPKAVEAIGRLNGLLQDLADATNHGRPYDLGKLADRHGLSLEEARQAEEVLTRHDREMAVDLPGGLPGVPALPPSGRMKMQRDLARCDLFRFQDSPEAQRLFAEVQGRIQGMRPPARASRVRTLLTLRTLPSVLEEIDDPPCDDPDHTVLKYSLYLLCRADDEYHGTDDYATEILRLFWHVLTESKERADLRRFTRQYAVWCREVLLRAGLAEEGDPSIEETSAIARPRKPGAPFPMRATPFFKAWVRLGKTS